MSIAAGVTEATRTPPTTMSACTLTVGDELFPRGFLSVKVIDTRCPCEKVCVAATASVRVPPMFFQSAVDSNVPPSDDAIGKLPFVAVCVCARPETVTLDPSARW